MKKIPGFYVKKTCKDQYSIQDTDPRKILEGSEVRNTLLLWRVIHGNGDGFNFYFLPGRSYQDFYFKFIFSGEKMNPLEWGQGIGPETGLGIRGFDARFNLKP